MAIQRFGKVMQRVNKRGKIMSGASFRSVEDAIRLEKQYIKDELAGHPVEVGTKREQYLKKRKR